MGSLLLLTIVCVSTLGIRFWTEMKFHYKLNACCPLYIVKPKDHLRETKSKEPSKKDYRIISLNPLRDTLERDVHRFLIFIYRR